MIRFFFLRLILPVILLLLVRVVLRSIFATFRGPSPSQTNRPPTVPEASELKKDPVCGTYVSTAASLTRTVNGSLVHFCSKECRDKYRVA
jgi:YHS domain-containing protein